MRFDFRGEETNFRNDGWRSCQVGQSRIFQINTSDYRILKINRSERSFTIERSQRHPIPCESPFLCLTNFKDQFAICIIFGCSFRYSFAQDKWEKLPPFEGSKQNVKVCSLGDKVYVLEPLCGEGTIRVLHNPDASFSSQSPPHWQEVVGPQYAISARLKVAFVPLNSTEIAILGVFGSSGKL